MFDTQIRYKVDPELIRVGVMKSQMQIADSGKTRTVEPWRSLDSWDGMIAVTSCRVNLEGANLQLDFEINLT